MRRTALLALGTVFLVGCQDSPTAIDFNSFGGAPSLEISDALHQPGNPHFFFLPPMVRKSKTKPSGEFLEDLNPVVEITCLDDSGLPQCPSGFPLLFTTQGGPRGERDRIKEHRKDYRVKWDTKRFGLDDDRGKKKKKKKDDEVEDGPVFRITVRVGLALGFADVQLVETARGPGFRRGIGRDSDPILLEDGRKLDIRFFIEEGALCDPGVTTCVEETFDVQEGGTALGEFGDPDDPVTAGLTIAGLGGSSPSPGGFQGASVAGPFSGFGVRLIHDIGNRVLGLPLGAATAAQGAGGQITVVLQECLLLDEETGEPVLDKGGNPILVGLDVANPTFGPCFDIKLFDENGDRITSLVQEATVFACIEQQDLNVGDLGAGADLTAAQAELIRIHSQDEGGATALPLRPAAACDDVVVGSAGSSGFMRFAMAVRDRLFSLVAPEPLLARWRRINVLHGAAPRRFSRFQFALPSKMAKVEGTDNQTALVGEAVANPPAVLVTDAENNPVKGAQVMYVAAGGDLVSDDPVLTGADGIAAVTSWTPTAIGEIQLTASGFGISDGPAPLWDPTDVSETPLDTGEEIFTAEGVPPPFATIPAPGFQPSGLAYDGTSLYVSELSGFRRIFTLNPTTGSVVASFLAPSSTGLDGNGNPSDIVYDGAGRLFVSDIGDFESFGMVYEIDVAGTTIFNSFSLPFRGGAIAFDGTNLYIGDIDSPEILVTTRLGAEVRTFSSGLRPAGMVFNASGKLWVISEFDNKISEITTLGVLIRQCDGPREPGVQGLGGVTLVGSELYIAEVSDPDPFDEPDIPGTIFIVDPETLTCAPPPPPTDLTGVWTGTYSWNCDDPGDGSRSGSEAIVFDLTDNGDGSIDGQVSYLGGSAILSGTRFTDAQFGDFGIIGGTVDPAGLEISLENPASDQFVNNQFSGTLAGQEISGVTLNGDSGAGEVPGCSAGVGPSGTFSVTRAGS